MGVYDIEIPHGDEIEIDMWEKKLHVTDTQPWGVEFPSAVEPTANLKLKTVSAQVNGTWNSYTSGRKDAFDFVGDFESDESVLLRKIATRNKLLTGRTAGPLLDPENSELTIDAVSDPMRLHGRVDRLTVDRQLSDLCDVIIGGGLSVGVSGVGYFKPIIPALKAELSPATVFEGPLHVCLRRLYNLVAERHAIKTEPSVTPERLRELLASVPPPPDPTGLWEAAFTGVPATPPPDRYIIIAECWGLECPAIPPDLREAIAVLQPVGVQFCVFARPASLMGVDLSRMGGLSLVTLNTFLAWPDGPLELEEGGEGDEWSDSDD